MTRSHHTKCSIGHRTLRIRCSKGANGCPVSKSVGAISRLVCLPSVKMILNIRDAGFCHHFSNWLSLPAEWGRIIGHWACFRNKSKLLKKKTKKCWTLSNCLLFVPENWKVLMLQEIVIEWTVLWSVKSWSNEVCNSTFWLKIFLIVSRNKAIVYWFVQLLVSSSVSWEPIWVKYPI